MTTEPGQVYKVDLGYVGKIRMMVVVSVADAEAPRALAACVPITTAFRGSWYEIPLGRKSFFREQSYANIQGIQAVQHNELRGPIGKLTPGDMTGIRGALARMFGFSEDSASSRS